MVHADRRIVVYKLNFRQLILAATASITFMAGTMAVLSFPSTSFAFLPIGWIWLVGANLGFGLPRFNSFLRRAIDTAPRLTATASK
jgi:hypothetical protein